MADCLQALSLQFDAETTLPVALGSVILRAHALLARLEGET